MTPAGGLPGTVPRTGGIRAGRPPLLVRLDRDVPYPPEQVRSVTLGFDAGRLYLDVTAEVPVAVYPQGSGPDPARVAGVDLGIIHPYAAAGPADQGLVVSGRAIRAECRQHLRDRKARSRAAARRAPGPGQRGSRRGRRHKRRAPRPGTCGGSARPSTRPPRPSWAGRWSTGWGRSRSATPAAS